MYLVFLPRTVGVWINGFIKASAGAQSITRPLPRCALHHYCAFANGPETFYSVLFFTPVQSLASGLFHVTKSI